MNWLTRVRNALPFATKKETPDNLWHKCPGCSQMVFVKDYRENLSVCPLCDHHGRIGPADRFTQLFDAGYTVLASPKAPEDPLKFRDTKKYPDRLKSARGETGNYDALLNAKGTIQGQRAVVGVQDFGFMGGSMGVAVGEAFIAGVKAAIADRAPYIIFTASGGARMQEGILSLMQMPKMTVGVEMLRDAGLPYIVVMTDPTSGGVMASYATLGDIHLAEPGATLAFTGRRVIENTIREKLPDDFQTSEYLLEHGMLDMIVARKDLPEMLSRLIGFLMPEKLAA
jgi:acetyl-CoA carboxylase carboxyl transferase subunit beta